MNINTNIASFGFPYIKIKYFHLQVGTFIVKKLFGKNNVIALWHKNFMNCITYRLSA